MPFTQEQLDYAGYAALDHYLRTGPHDQYNTERPFLNKLRAGQKSFPGSKEYIIEKLRITNDSNFQWFAPDGQVSYNRKRTLLPANFNWGSSHDGFALTEEELAQNFITMTDDKSNAPTTEEMEQLVNLIEENTETLKLGFDEKFDLDMHRDGTQDAEAIIGLDAIVPVDNDAGVLGGIDRSVAGNAFWRSQVSLDVAKANLPTVMEGMWRQCRRVGGYQPNFILAGSTFIDIYKDVADSTIDRQMTVRGKGGTDMDLAINAVNFKGVPIIWDPVFFDLDAADSPTQEWESRCYFLNTRFLTLRPMEGQDMIVRNPPRAYDRYTHYWGLTWRGGITTNRPSAMGLITVTGS